MPRHEVIELMTTLKLAGMRLNYDEIVTAGRRRKRDFEAILCDLLAVEIADKKARSIRYQEKIPSLISSFFSLNCRSYFASFSHGGSTPKPPRYLCKGDVI